MVSQRPAKASAEETRSVGSTPTPSAKPTQKERVLSMLKTAGPKGVRSDTFYREFMGRGVARVHDLRCEGHSIESERVGKYVVYRLTEGSVGSRAGSSQNTCPASGEASAGATPLAPADPARLFEDEVKPRSQYDAWGDAA